MKASVQAERKFCGNCGNHNAYNYPEQVFCTRRLSENKEPVVDTLWRCGEWNPSSQECYCIEEALRKRNK